MRANDLLFSVPTSPVAGSSFVSVLGTPLLEQAWMLPIQHLVWAYLSIQTRVQTCGLISLR